MREKGEQFNFKHKFQMKIGTGPRTKNTKMRNPTRNHVKIVPTVPPLCTREDKAAAAEKVMIMSNGGEQQALFDDGGGGDYVQDGVVETVVEFEEEEEQRVEVMEEECGKGVTSVVDWIPP